MDADTLNRKLKKLLHEFHEFAQIESLQGWPTIAQGNALGKPVKIFSSPTRAAKSTSHI
jgi:hypothetical protein